MGSRHIAVGLGALLIVGAVRAADDGAIAGFTAASSRRQAEAEDVLLGFPSPARCEALHAQLTRGPHVAGTEGAQRVAEEIAWTLGQTGLQTEVVSYDVLLSWPRRVEVEL